MDNGVGRGKPMRLRTEAASSRGLRHEAGEEKAMKDIDRRSAVALGVAAATAIVGRTAVAKEWTKLRLGISADDPPNSSVRADGTLQGFEIDLAGDICKRMKVECEWVRQDFEGLIPALRQGKFDVIFTLLAITPKRREAINFSIPIAGERGGVLVTKTSPIAKVTAGDIDVVSLDDTASAQPAIDALATALQGKVIGTDVGSIRAELAKRYFQGSELRTYPTPPTGDVSFWMGILPLVSAECRIWKRVVPRYSESGRGSLAGLLVQELVSG
jgi:ABC-type amino acid transport substrate-binding protein